MALWKPFRGNRTALDSVEKHDGYVYFCTDDGSLFFDYTDAAGVLQRKQLNAKEAESLVGFNPNDYQLKSDSTLTTENKTVVEAINELNLAIAEYILNIDYDSLLAFDTTELVVYDFN
jgi:hypothetical protein